MFCINARFLAQSVTGVQRFAIEISKIIKEKLHDEVQFYAPENIIDNDLATQLDVHIVGSKTGHLWEQIELPQFLRSIGSPLLINLCNTAPLFYKNKIVTIHDIAFEVYPETYTKFFLYFYKILIPRIIKNSKKIITVSNFSKKEIIKYYKTEEAKISVVYNAVGQEFHAEKNPALQSQNYFLAVSSLNYRKNLPLVLESFNLLSKERMDIKLFIIGSLDQNSFTKLDLEKYKKNTQIEFKGRVSDKELIEYYSNALAFIYPSFYEGFGIPPLEAQKCDCPSITSNTSCLPEIFKESVLYCNPKNMQSLLGKMQEILNPKIRSNLVEKGQVNVSHYSWEKSCNELINIIKANQK